MFEGGWSDRLIGLQRSRSSSTASIQEGTGVVQQAATCVAQLTSSGFTARHAKALHVGAALKGRGKNEYEVS